MKKFLVVLLALTMVFAFSATAFAADEQIADYTDVTAENEFGAAIYRLTALGVLEGDGIGTTYRPVDNLTRGEFAKIAVYLTNNEDLYDYYAMMPSAFADVSASHWAKGWINAAKDLGLMKGRSATVFDADGKVSMQEVATVVLRALGYNDNLEGDWPNDYSRKAAEVGLLDYVRYVGPEYIQRGEMASIANEALDCYMVSYVANDVAQGLGYVWGNVDLDGFAPMIGYTNEDLGTREAYNYMSMLEYAFNAITGDVLFWDDAELFSEGTGWAYDDFEDGEILFQLGDLDEDDTEIDYVASVDVASAYYIYGGDLTDLGGQMADLTIVFDKKIKYEDGEITNDDFEVVFAELTSTVERIEDSSKNYIKDGDGYLLAKEGYGEIFKDEDGDVYWAKDFSVFDHAPFYAFNGIDGDFADFIYYDGRSIDDSARLSKIHEYIEDLVDAELDGYVIYKAGEGFVDIEELAVGDILYFAGLFTEEGEGEGEDVVLILALGAETGDLDRAWDDAVRIDDVKYFSSGHSFVYDFDEIAPYDLDLIDDFKGEVTFAKAYAFVDFAYVSKDIESTTTYGVVTDYLYKAVGASNYVYDLTDDLEAALNVDYTTVIYTTGGATVSVVEDVDFTDDTVEIFIPANTALYGIEITYVNEDGELDTKDVELEDYWADLYIEDGPAILFESFIPIGSLIEYDLNDDDNLEFDMIGTNFSFFRAGEAIVDVDDFGPFSTYFGLYEDSFTVKVDEDDRELKFDGETYELAEDAEIYSVDVDNNGQYDGVELLDVDDVLAGDFSCYQIAAVYVGGRSDDIIDVLYIVGFDDAEANTAIGFLTDAQAGKDLSGDDPIYKIEIDGGEFTATKDVYNDNDTFDGALIAYTTNAKDKVTAIEVLEPEDVVTISGDKYIVAFGTVQDVDASRLKITFEEDEMGDKGTFSVKKVAEGHFYDMDENEALDGVDDFRDGDFVLFVFEEDTNNIYFIGLLGDL